MALRLWIKLHLITRGMKSPLKELCHQIKGYVESVSGSHLTTSNLDLSNQTRILLQEEIFFLGICIRCTVRRRGPLTLIQLVCYSLWSFLLVKSAKGHESEKNPRSWSHHRRRSMHACWTNEARDAPLNIRFMCFAWRSLDYHRAKTCHILAILRGRPQAFATLQPQMTVLVASAHPVDQHLLNL